MRSLIQTLHRPVNALTGRHSIQRILMAAIVALFLVSSISSVFAWTNIMFVPGSTPEALWPHVRVSSTGKVHVLWHDLDGNVRYIRGQLASDGNSVSWEAMQSVTTTKTKYNGISLEVGPDDKVHVTVLGTDHRVYYLYSATGNSGTWAKEATSLDECGWGVDLALDSAGTPFVTCGLGLGDGDAYAEVGYRRGPMSWSNPQNVVGSKGYLVRNNRVAVTGSGSSAVVHVLYEYHKSESERARVYYSRGGRDGPYGYVDITTQLGYSVSDLPLLEVDHGTGRIYGGFVTGGTSSGYRLVLITSNDQGSNWQPIGQVLIGSDKWAANSDAYSSGGVAHIVSEHKYWDGKGFSTHRVFYNSYNPSTATLSSPLEIDGNEKSTAPSIGGGGSGKIGVWIKGNTDGVRYSVDPGGGGGSVEPTATPTATPTPGPTATPTPPPDQPEGSLTVNNGANLATDSKVLVTLMLKQGKADKYRLWNSGTSEPATFTDMNALTAPASYSVQNWQLPTDSDPETNPCSVNTIYGKFHYSTSNKTSAPMSGVINVDPGVDADVTVEGTSQGDPIYTSEPYYMVDVQARAGECSGLKQVRVGEESVTAQSTGSESALAEVPVEYGSIASSRIPLNPQETGEHSVVVEVTDGIDHSYEYRRTIIYDAASPQVISNTGTLRTAKQSSPISSTRETWVDLSFDELQVKDYLDGASTQETTGQPFWGVMLANSRELISDTTKLDGQWVPVQVENPSASNGYFSFTIADWDLFTNLPGNLQTSGEYYVYARIMDAAGNTSDHLLTSNALQLEPGFTILKKPEVFLPVILR